MLLPGGSTREIFWDLNIRQEAHATHLGVVAIEAEPARRLEDVIVFVTGADVLRSRPLGLCSKASGGRGVGLAPRPKSWAVERRPELDCGRPAPED